MRLPGVYRPQCDTWLLANTMTAAGAAHGARVLDVCAGTGALAITAARSGARNVTAVDSSERAVLAARMNAALAGRRVRVLHGDLFAPVREERFDLVVANPPYVPDGDGLPHAAWDAGTDGRAVIDRICTAAPAALAPGGTLLLTHDGATVTSDRFVVAVCACRRSRRYPLCDTSHRRKTRRSGGQ